MKINQEGHLKQILSEYPLWQPANLLATDTNTFLWEAGWYVQNWKHLYFGRNKKKVLSIFCIENWIWSFLKSWKNSLFYSIPVGWVLFVASQNWNWDSSLDIYPNFIDACVTALWQWAIENTSLYSVAKYPWIATWARINTQQVRYRPGSGNVHSYSYPVNLNYVCALEFTFH